MCEYQRINFDKPKEFPICIIDNKDCTFCVLGNAKKYKEAKGNKNEKNINFIKRFVRKMPKDCCPECGGQLQCELFDIILDCLVYKCKECGKEWV